MMHDLASVTKMATAEQGGDSDKSELWVIVGQESSVQIRVALGSGGFDLLLDSVFWGGMRQC